MGDAKIMTSRTRKSVKKWVSGLLLPCLVLGQIQPVWAAKGGGPKASAPDKGKPSAPPSSGGGSSSVSLAELTGNDTPATDTSSGTLQPQSLTLSAASEPGGGGSPDPQRAVNQFQFDPYSGSGAFSLPLYTPPGRKGAQPSLNLSYSPRGGNDILGMGWVIDLGHIERSTKNGFPKYDASDTFLASLGGSASELVAAGGGEYRARVEGGFLKFKQNGDTWEVQDRQGTIYYFGLQEQLGDESRVSDAQGRIFRWYLSEIKDVQGNYVFIRRFADGSFDLRYT